MRLLWIGLLSLLLVLAACADEGDPAQAVEQYFQAQLDGDVNELRGLLCTNLEAEVEDRANSLAGLDAELRDVECTRGDTEGEYTIVNCEGVIFINYGTENSELPLASYRTILEDGQWKMCGEA